MGALWLYSPPFTWVGPSIGFPIVLGIFWFLFGYFKQFRNHKDITLDYRGMQFAIFVLGRFAIPCVCTIYGVFAIVSGRFDALFTATLLMSMFLGSDAAELSRMKQNDSAFEV